MRRCISNDDVPFCFQWHVAQCLERTEQKQNVNRRAYLAQFLCKSHLKRAALVIENDGFR